MSSTQQGRQVNRATLADIFGVSLPTVTNWVRTGCPVVERGGSGKEWTFNTADVYKWLRERDSKQAEPADIAELKRRKLEAETKTAELEYAIKSGIVAPVEMFKRAESQRNILIRTHVMNVPQRAVLQLLGETDETRFKKVLTNELRAALSAAAAATITLDAPSLTRTSIESDDNAP